MRKQQVLRAAVALAATAVLAIPATASAEQLIGSRSGDEATPRAQCFFVTGSPETNPNMTQRRTVAAVPDRGRGAIHVRAGYWNGTLVGWSRVVNGNDLQYITLKVDQNGDRVPDESYGNPIWQGNTSCVYPTSASPNRAFRACVKIGGHSGPCAPNFMTAWW